jgi:hypothetical protein
MPRRLGSPGQSRPRSSVAQLPLACLTKPDSRQGPTPVSTPVDTPRGGLSEQTGNSHCYFQPPRSQARFFSYLQPCSVFSVAKRSGPPIVKVKGGSFHPPPARRPSLGRAPREPEFRENARTLTYGTARAEELFSSAAAESYSEGAIGLFPVAWRIFARTKVRCLP